MNLFFEIYPLNLNNLLPFVNPIYPDFSHPTLLSIFNFKQQAWEMPTSYHVIHQERLMG